MLLITSGQRTTILSLALSLSACCYFLNHFGTKDFLACSVIPAVVVAGLEEDAAEGSSSFFLGGGGGRTGFIAVEDWSCNRSISKHLALSRLSSSSSA